MNGNSRRLAIYLPSYESGGVERMLVNLARGLVCRNIDIDFVVGPKNPRYVDLLPSNINLIELESNSDESILEKSVSYIKKHRPDILLTSKPENEELALKAKILAQQPLKLVFRTATNVSALMKNRNAIKRWLYQKSLKKRYKLADIIITVSKGVANDIFNITGIPRERIRVAHNPVVTPELKELAKQSITHPWFSPSAPSIIIGIGRLGRAKNFSLLIKAFAIVEKQIQCHLIILGEGRANNRLNNLIKNLNLTQKAQLLGYVNNPYAYLSRSSLFVLSSNWEGSPNVLIEALTLGIPVVSTDCESGPREILQHGKIGKLVPINNIESMANAMITTLKSPTETNRLIQATRNYTMENSAIEYSKILGI